MPKPENIRRIVTGPKSENRSIRKSRSMLPHSSLVVPASAWRAPGPITTGLRGYRAGAPALLKTKIGGYGSRLKAGTTWVRSAPKLTIHLRRRQLYGFAATAGAGLVRIVEDELRRHLVGLVIHLGAQQEQHRLAVDQDLHALVLDDFFGRSHLVGIFDRIGLPGAAAIHDPDAKADDLGIGAFCQLSDPLRGSLGQPHDLRARPRLRLGYRHW